MVFNVIRVHIVYVTIKVGVFLDVMTMPPTTVSLRSIFKSWRLCYSGKGGFRHFGLGSGRPRKIDTKIRTPLGGSGGMPPSKFLTYSYALRQLLVRSEASNCTTNFRGYAEFEWYLVPIYLVPIAIEIPGHVPELNLHAILKLN